MLDDNSVSIVLPVYNQQDLIYKVIGGILSNASPNVKELLIILDGCTDHSEENACKAIKDFSHAMEIKFFIKQVSEWEVLCCNTGFKNSSCKYSISIQDDIILTEKNYDIRWVEPFKMVSNMLCVSGRGAEDEFIDVNGALGKMNVAGRDVHSPRELLAIRDVINRPFMVDNIKLQELNYLDEEFAPIDGDDRDLCFRGYRRGWVSGCYVIDYESEIMWGTTRKNPNSYKIWDSSAIKNNKKIFERHFDLLNGEKHTQNYVRENVK
jgi:glycosyltransferase involved in cell wall biosynthesis